MAIDQDHFESNPEAFGPPYPMYELGGEQYIVASILDAPSTPHSLAELVISTTEIEGARDRVALSYLDVPTSVDTDATVGIFPSTQVSTLEKPKDKREVLKKPNFKPRPAAIQDIPELVDIDMRAFDSVYRNYDMTSEELRADLETKFRGRFEKLGGDWIQVLETESGKLAGFMMCCPTNKTPEDFTSWEVTTNNGTLEGTYDPEGKNLYVVTMTMTPEGSKYHGQDILYVNQLGKMVEQGIGRSFFESRIPGFRSWASLQAKHKGASLDEMDSEQRLSAAQEYVELTKSLHGKEVRFDKLLRIYDEYGADFIKVAPDAYQDAPSMNFGVVCVIKNPLPEFMQKSPILSKIGGKAIRFLSRHRKLMDKVF